MAASSSTAIALASARTTLSPLALSNFSPSLLKTNQNSLFLRKSFKIHGGGNLSIRAMCSGSSSASFGSRLEDSVKKIVADNSVVIYSKSWCSYSSEVKSLFKRLGVQPMVIELDQLGPQGPQLQKVLERLTGQHTVPNVFIGGKHIGGCTDTLKLHRQGDLQPMLSEASSKNS